MITKAIIEELVSPYEVKVRIPIFDSVSSAAFSTKSENLHVATICSLPNCYVNLQVGDIVFIAFENATYDDVVVLGHLSREAMTKTYADITLRSLLVNDCAKLPTDTFIGSLTPAEISCLTGITSNIQKQISTLRDKQDRIFAKVFPEEVET